MPSLEELLWERHLQDGAKRFAKQLLFNHVVPGGRRRVGRPHHVWPDAAHPGGQHGSIAWLVGTGTLSVT